MMRLIPCEEPLALGMSNCSSPSTFLPRLASCQTVAEPIPPTPTTMSSYRSLTRSHPCRVGLASEIPALPRHLLAGRSARSALRLRGHLLAHSYRRRFPSGAAH